jgi:hypothetical protein
MSAKDLTLFDSEEEGTDIFETSGTVLPTAGRHV